LQYNKRDLPEVVPVEELDRALNSRKWPIFEASATTGLGVFDTLKGISKLTLVSLKRKLTKVEAPGKPAVPRPATGLPVAAASTAPPRPSAPPPKPAATRPGKLDVLAELERIRKQALSAPTAPTPAPAVRRPLPPPAAKPAVPAPGRHAASPASPSLNGKGEIHRSVELTLRRAEFRRARRFLLNLRVEDDEMRTVDSIRDLPIEISDPADLERVLLHLNVALRSKD
jgi:hypothetical protein